MEEVSVPLPFAQNQGLNALRTILQALAYENKLAREIVLGLDVDLGWKKGLGWSGLDLVILDLDYIELLWEGLHYVLEHPSTLILYLRFIKLIVGHYMTAYPEISRRVRDKYHNLEHDEMIKSIFNSRKNKAGVRMKIPSWMITDEMKLTENYQIYAKVFRVDVPTTQS
ncbi:hypothetical protein Tco_0964116 [Tanacetum coccineum]